MTENEQKDASLELMKRIKAVCVSFLLEKESYQDDADVVVSAALMTSLAETTALSLNVVTEFNPTESEITTLAEGMAHALDTGIREYVKILSKHKDTTDINKELLDAFEKLES